MFIVELIYVNSDFKTMINFEVEIGLSYEQAYAQYPEERYIQELLKKAKPIIQDFGNAIRLPNEFAMYMNDAELDYFLLQLHKDVDLLIREHIYVLLPSYHATSFMSRSSNGCTWRINGIGLNSVVMACKDADSHVLISTLSFQELYDQYVVHKCPIKGNR